MALGNSLYTEITNAYKGGKAPQRTITTLVSKRHLVSMLQMAVEAAAKQSMMNTERKTISIILYWSFL